MRIETKGNQGKHSTLGYDSGTKTEIKIKIEIKMETVIRIKTETVLDA